uniref:Uncharacterized protein n=1 Tax=Megaselia scalaris TaxID=36166 RepID=T1GA78_MEGSC
MELSADNLDEDEEPRCIQLTNQHKTAIRFIRKVSSFTRYKIIYLNKNC